MLILGRRSQQSIYINDGEIKISILKVEGNSVRVGIEAPKHISVHREEIFLRIQQAKINEALTPANDVEEEVA